MASTNRIRVRGVSTAMMRTAVIAAEGDLEAYLTSRDQADRERFLAAMDDLIPFTCEWAEAHQDDDGLTESAVAELQAVRGPFLRCNKARNELIGYSPEDRR